MKKNPFLNAVIATAYIIGIVNVVNFTTHMGEDGAGNSVLMPMAMISLFTLSAAVMGYLFLYGPIELYIAGQKKEAVQFFLKTVFTFAITTSILFVFLWNSFGVMK